MTVIAALAAISIPNAFASMPLPKHGDEKPSAKPPAAQTLMDSAYARSKKEKKPVLLMLHATWCGWCKRLQKVLDVPEFKKMLDTNYVVVHLDVMERGEEKDKSENDGGVKLMADLGGEKSGLPFYAILDATGKKLADSNALPGNQNIGYPGSPEEIRAFAKLLKDTAPHLSAGQLDKFTVYLKEHAPAAH